MKPNSGHRDDSRLSCGAGLRSWCFLCRHLRADAAEGSAAFLTLAQVLPWPARSSWPTGAGRPPRATRSTLAAAPAA